MLVGDARLALNCLELMVDMADETKNGKKIDRTLLKEVLGERQAKFDKQGDRFYDLISALHKSVRGSAPDAALYWYARILTAGGDPLYVARRLLAIASEDVGMQILVLCKSHWLHGIALLAWGLMKGSEPLLKLLSILR